MRKNYSIFPLLLLLFLCFSCQEESKEIEPSQPAIQNSVTPFKVEVVPFDGKIDPLKNREVESRVSCSLDNDQGCSSSVGPIIEDYVRFCTSYPYKTTFSGQVVNYYFILSYYVDGDDDINLDQYQDDIQAQVSAVADLVGQPLFLVSAEILSWPCNTRANNNATVKYTAYY